MEDPCACIEGCGFSSGDGTCSEGSTTDCTECTTGEGCTEGSCENCEGEFDPTKTCQYR
eukprot:UN03880